MPFLKPEDAKRLSLALVLVAGVLIAFPYLNFQDYLSQGDHGRDLYAAQAVYRGELPYKDFWWVYGPLMPYYYGLFFKIFGTKISSIILGKLALQILGGLLMALGLMEIASPAAAFLCGCWFMLFHQDFFFTYNHLGGLVAIIGIAYCLLSYIQRGALKDAWKALGLIFILCLIKVNFGLAALAVCVITVGVCAYVKNGDSLHFSKKNGGCPHFYAVALLGIPLITFLIYWSLLHGLSINEIRQCLPYKEGDQPYEVSLWTAIVNFATITWHTITSSWMNMGFAVLINACGLRSLYLIVKNKMPAGRRTVLLLSLGMLSLFYIANSHEYLKSGVWYRDFWAQPLSIMIIFVLIDTAAASLQQTARKLIFTVIGLMAIFCWFSVMRSVNALKTDNQFFGISRGGIYISNAPAWIATVEETTDFLNKTLKPDELFFALPYDCLYYYLTDKKAPTRQLIFFEHIKIPPEQEKSIIADLERNHVNYVLMSNRAFARQELGLGFLGSTYCPLIGQYLRDNFVPIARFGDWQHEPGWAWNHGTMILKRKST